MEKKKSTNLQNFATYRPMIEITGGLSLSQVCAITKLQSSSIQNWVKRGYVPHPENKKYYERHLARILLINALKDSMNLENVGELMVLINGDADDTKDDIVSETALYDYYCQIINSLDHNDMSDENLDNIIKSTIASDLNADKLVWALKTMVYAYITSAYLKKVNASINELRKY